MTQKEIKQLRKNTRQLISLSKKISKKESEKINFKNLVHDLKLIIDLQEKEPQSCFRAGVSIKGIKELLKVLELKVYIYEQRVPKDGHGFVVIIAETRELADAQFLNEYQRLWPKSSAADQLAHLKNAKVTVKPVWPSIVLDDHGI